MDETGQPPDSPDDRSPRCRFDARLSHKVRLPGRLGGTLLAMEAAVRRGRTPFGLTMLAVAYSLGLLCWVIAIPIINGETLVQYGGPWSVAITA